MPGLSSGSPQLPSLVRPPNVPPEVVEPNSGPGWGRGGGGSGVATGGLGAGGGGGGVATFFATVLTAFFVFFAALPAVFLAFFAAALAFFFVFLTGTAGYFDTELDRWMQPERPLPRPALSADAAISIGLARLANIAPDAERWIVRLPQDRHLDIFLFWSRSATDQEPGRAGRELLDSAAGTPTVHRETGGG